MNRMIRWSLFAILTVMNAALLVGWHFDNTMRRAHANAAQGSQLLATRCVL